MKPLRNRLQEARKRLGIPWEVLERDYILSWILAGVSHVEALRETLIFKGGTALKKCYFGDYRFSEDLDFSGIGNVPTGEAMEAAIQEVCDAAARLLDEYAPVEIVCERYAVHRARAPSWRTRGVHDSSSTTLAASSTNPCYGRNRSG
jgi:predicted nucleotidyltransferase component of viral defense system